MSYNVLLQSSSCFSIRITMDLSHSQSKFCEFNPSNRNFVNRIRFSDAKFDRNCHNRYIFFVTLLSIPESSFSIAFKMFDLDNNG